MAVWSLVSGYRKNGREAEGRGNFGIYYLSDVISSKKWGQSLSKLTNFFRAWQDRFKEVFFQFYYSAMLKSQV